MFASREADPEKWRVWWKNGVGPDAVRRPEIMRTLSGSPDAASLRPMHPTVVVNSSANHTLVVRSPYCGYVLSAGIWLMSGVTSERCICIDPATLGTPAVAEALR